MTGLACPRCDTVLEGFRCRACRVDFPTLDCAGTALAVLCAEPQATLADWRNRWSLALAEIDAEIAATRRSEGATPATRARLAHLNTGLERYKAELGALLAPLRLAGGAAAGGPAKETLLALRTRLPPHHHVLSYAGNVHRDWCWGDDENAATLEAVMASLEAAGAARPANVLVPGAGAGRLAYDLHAATGADRTVGLDTNPFLGIVACTVSAGTVVPLTELPLAPVHAEDVAVARELVAPPAREGLDFVCADALRMPYAARSFDLVVTPWLVDVIDAAPDVLAREIARVLKLGGCWLNHGSVAFAGSAAARLTAGELDEVVAAGGFRIADARDVRLPYLQSPASRQRREETCHTFAAVLESPPDDAERRRHDHLPDWIVTGRTPVPLTPAFQTQIGTTRIHAFIMSLIDGKRSLDDMAGILEQQRLMSRTDGVQALRSFLTTMHEEARRSG